MKISCILVILAFGLINCSPLCGEKSKVEVISPGEKYLAVVFERNCGATTGFVSHVNMRAHSDSFSVNPTGTITGGQVFIIEGRPVIELVWKDETHLEIMCSECTAESTHKKEMSWNAVTISYRDRK
jgi:hypothetical protein